MQYLIGILLASAVSLASTFIGFDKDRAFYPTVLVVIVSYCCLFAVMGGSTAALVTGSCVMALFFGAAAFGFRRNLRVVVAALMAHGVFDFFHGSFIANPGVPQWWPMFRLTDDVVAGLYLARLLRRSRIAVRAP